MSTNLKNAFTIKTNEEPKAMTDFKVSEYAAMRKPLMCIAHRGFSGRYPENTLLAFEKAIDAGADIIEFDVTLSVDDHMVVFHDGSTKRFTGKMTPVEDLTLKEIQSIDIGAGQKIPTLEQVLDKCTGRIGMNIHTKKPGCLCERVVELCRKADNLDQIFLALSRKDDILQIKEKYPDVWICSLYKQDSIDMVEANADLGVKLLQPYAVTLRLTGEDMVEKAKKSGMVMGVCAANTFSEYRWLSNLGVGGILTDFPDMFSRHSNFAE